MEGGSDSSKGECFTRSLPFKYFDSFSWKEFSFSVIPAPTLPPPPPGTNHLWIVLLVVIALQRQFMPMEKPSTSLKISHLWSKKGCRCETHKMAPLIIYHPQFSSFAAEQCAVASTCPELDYHRLVWPGAWQPTVWTLSLTVTLGTSRVLFFRSSTVLF